MLAAQVERHTVGRGLWKWTHYFDAYERHLAKFVGEAVNVVEIGVYICEDVAGVNNLFHDYLAGLARNLDAWHAPEPRESRTIPSRFQMMIASIHRYPYLVVIERVADPPHEFNSMRRGTEWVPF